MLKDFETTWKPKRVKFIPVAKLNENGEIIEVHYCPRVFEKEYKLRPGNISQSIFHNLKSFGVKYQYIEEQVYFNLKPITLIS